MSERVYLEVGSSERVGAVGATGSGKTFWMVRFVTQLENVIIIDTKRTVNLPGFKIIKGSQKNRVRDERAALQKAGRIIFRPGDGELSPQFFGIVRRMFEGERKPEIVVYLDEAGHITSPSRIDKDLRYLIQAGREGGIGIWWAAQRPSVVNNSLISESERLFVFELRVKADRDKLAGVWGDSVQIAGDLGPREFIAYGRNYDAIQGVQTGEGYEAYVLEYGGEDAA